MSESLLTSACYCYLAFLEKENRGTYELEIRDFNFLDEQANSGRFEVSFNLKLKMLDNLVFVLPDGSEVMLDDSAIIQRIYYDKLERLEIECGINLFHQIKKALISKTLRVYNDLRFLINNLIDFFKKYTPALPIYQPSIEPYVDVALSEAQINAVNGILTKSISYIWGPPGSGKTQYVLFYSILSLLKANKKICILAPTNSALEQILFVLLEKLESVGIDSNCALRLGIPSASFLHKYPNVCETYVREVRHLFSISLQDRYAMTHIFAMTLDGFIKKYPVMNIKFDHIFLDECAFTPLIKALSICVDNTPFTLLGDHKQLAPICEMPQNLMINENICARLWGFSAIFIEDFFINLSKLLEKDFQDQASICLKNTFKLDQTYRYGKNLAELLDKAIYHNRLFSTQADTQIFYVDCKEKERKHKNIALSEVEASIYLFKELKEKDVAIITPFVSQRMQMIKSGIPSDVAMTIHSSQGREFEIVIFSPVRLSYPMTDSRNIQALYTLNVAISRLKKCFILVCDVSFWSSCHGQFISEIIKLAKPYHARSIL